MDKKIDKMITCWSFSTEFGMENCALYNVEEKRFSQPIKIGQGKLTYVLKPFRNYLLFNVSKLKNSVYYFGITRLYNFNNVNLVEQHLFEVMIPSSVVDEIINDPYAPSVLRDFLRLKPIGKEPAIPDTEKKHIYASRDWKVLVDRIENYLDEVT